MNNLRSFDEDKSPLLQLQAGQIHIMTLCEYDGVWFMTVYMYTTIKGRNSDVGLKII